MDIKQFWRAVLAQNEGEIRKYFHADAYVNWHCTNERFNVDEFIIANCEYPGEWEGEVERVETVNDLIITVTLIYPKDRSAYYHAISKQKTIKLQQWTNTMPMTARRRNGDWISA